GVMRGGGEVAPCLEEPIQGGVHRGAVDREVAGVVPPLANPRRGPVGVAPVNPWAAGMGGVDLGEGTLEVERALHRPERTVEDVGPDPEGIALQPVAGDDPVTPGTVDRPEVPDPPRLHSPHSLYA